MRAPIVFLAAFAPIALFNKPVSAQEETIAKELAHCQANLSDCEDDILTSISLLQFSEKMCVPPDLKLNMARTVPGVQESDGKPPDSSVVKPVVDWFRQHQETAAMSYEKGMDAAIAALYPCK